MSSSPLAPGVHSFTWDDHQLSYQVVGRGEQVLIYMHGLLLDSELNRSIAETLAGSGHTVILLDLLGHGLSDKPAHAAHYRMDLFSRQVLALIEHLGVESAVIGGISLGANVSLMTAAADPSRIRGMVLEMPVLEWAAPAAALTFAPLVVLLRYGRLMVRLLSLVASRMPRSTIGPINSVLNTASVGPTVMASVLHGVLLGPVAPTAEERGDIDIPTLVLARRFDVIHPLDDARNLCKQLPDARMVVASPVSLRLNPEKYCGEIATFLDEVRAKPGVQVGSASAGSPAS